MAAEVKNPEIAQGVPTDHPRLVEGVQNALKRGYSKEATSKLTGAPVEVVESIRNKMEKK